MKQTTNNPNPAPIRPRVKDTEAAALLGLSVRTLRQWRLKGGGPEFLKLGSAVRYDLNALEAWAKSRARVNTSGDPQAAA
jgi:excisionase family DNA binding protein